MAMKIGKTESRDVQVVVVGQRRQGRLVLYLALMKNLMTDTQPLKYVNTCKAVNITWTKIINFES